MPADGSVVDNWGDVVNYLNPDYTQPGLGPDLHELQFFYAGGCETGLIEAYPDQEGTLGLAPAVAWSFGAQWSVGSMGIAPYAPEHTDATALWTAFGQVLFRGWWVYGKSADVAIGDATRYIVKHWISNNALVNHDTTQEDYPYGWYTLRMYQPGGGQVDPNIYDSSSN